MIQPTFGEIKYLDRYEIWGFEEMTFILDDTKLTISTDGQNLFSALQSRRKTTLLLQKGINCFAKKLPKMKQKFPQVVKGEKWACSTLEAGKNKPIVFIKKTRDSARLGGK